MNDQRHVEETRPRLSIVSPVYYAEKIIEELVRKISESVLQITEDFEIILVEDDSPDDSWAIISRLANEDVRIKGIRLSRNFGQHNAIAAGLESATGDYVVVMDCDLQDNPKYIPQLLAKAEEGYDIVYTKQDRRNHSFLKNLTARIYYKILSGICAFKLSPDSERIGSYSIISRKVVKAYLQFNDYRKAYLMVLQWLGFRHTFLPVVHEKRSSGKSSYTFRKLIKHALQYTISYSERLLYFSIYAGIFFSIISFIGIGLIIYQFFSGGSLEGWPSLMVAITFFGGLILLSLGVLGMYVGKVFEQTKNRPRYLIRQTINLEK